MDYIEDILQRMLNQLERRKKSDKPLVINVEKVYPDYGDNFSECQEKIDAAINQLIGWGIVAGKKNVRGYYTKIAMELSHCPQAYEMVHRKPRKDILQEAEMLIVQVLERNTGFVCQICKDFLENLEKGKFPGYSIGQDVDKLRNVLLILEKIDKLKSDTYVRNFSEAIFHDSKRFQALQGTIKHILMDYTPDAASEESILEQYGLYQNPPYVYFKGAWILYTEKQRIDVGAFCGGIALPITALSNIVKIELAQKKVISVENLTTYHDTPESGAAVLFLGGFPNQVRVDLLKLLYQNEPQAEYLHRGDLDPEGFLILENLRSKTKIPFKPLEMDLETLQHCFEQGHFRPLEQNDEKVMRYTMLAKYENIFAFMRQHNCKVEQECFEAMKLDL